MRVIEPHQLKHSKKQKAKPKKFRLIALVGVFCLVAGGGILLRSHASIVAHVLGRQTAEQEQEQYYVDDDFRFLAVPEFTDIYMRLAYPNTTDTLSTSSITGDKVADERIRAIATSRGYALSSLPVAPVFRTGDVWLQPKAHDGWVELEADAKSHGHDLRILSGYRSIDDQRTRFSEQLSSARLSSQRIASGQADPQIVQILQTTAIPGYSRHHTGYTVDLGCGSSLEPFDRTGCYQWLSSNNYLNAKKHGWIPSHPEGESDYITEAEPEEFSWVGKSVLLKDNR